MDNKRRVVVTGLGLVCALGDNAENCFQNALNGVSGIKEVKAFDVSKCYAKNGAEVAAPSCELSGEDCDRASLLCIKAAGEALADAGLDKVGSAERIGVIVGNCVGGAASIDKFFTDEQNGGGDPKDILKMPASAIANNVARHFGLGGVTANIVNACAAGTISLAYACDLIRAGKADAFAAGGSDSFSSLAFAGFHALHALDDSSCSPFNRSSGITLGEGAGILIIESYEHAAARGAKIYCEILGSGVSSDAHHITAPRPDGEGQMLAIKRAMESSALSAGEIGYINAHGTGTAKNDEAEFLSLHTLFDGTKELSVSSTKSMTGHCLGAAGSIEAVLTIKALCKGEIPPTIGYTDDDKAALAEKAGGIDFIANERREKPLSYAMSNSFAFGGNNASIIFAKEPHDIPDRTNSERIFVTGIGEYLSGQKQSIDIQPDDYKDLGIKMAFWRKLDRFSQLMLISGTRALSDAGITLSDDNAADIGIIIGTSDGPMTEIVSFQKNVIENGTESGSAFSFPNTVYNAAGGYFSIFAGIKGYNVTNANGVQAGLQSLCYAADVLRNGDEKIMVAAGVDECTEITRFLYERAGLLGANTQLGEGASSLILETESSANERGAKRYAELVGWASAHKSVPFGTLSGSEEALKAAILSACEGAGIGTADIGMVYGFANGCKQVDDIEKRVFAELFGGMGVIRENLWAHSADLLGYTEARAAGAAHSAACAAEMLTKNAAKDYALCVSYGTGGQYSAVVLKKAE